MEERLKPCIVCDGIPWVSSYQILGLSGEGSTEGCEINCCGISASGHGDTYEDAFDMAAKEWSRVNSYAEGGFCPKCGRHLRRNRIGMLPNYCGNCGTRVVEA